MGKSRYEADMKPQMFHNGRDISAKSNKRGGWFVFAASLIVLSHAAKMCQLCSPSGCLGKGEIFVILSSAFYVHRVSLFPHPLCCLVVPCIYPTLRSLRVHAIGTQTYF